MTLTTHIMPLYVMVEYTCRDKLYFRREKYEYYQRCVNDDTILKQYTDRQIIKFIELSNIDGNEIIRSIY